jgi:Transglycosylase
MRRWAKPCAAALLALGVPAGLATWVEHETARVTTAAAARLPGTPIAIGGIEVGLTGALRLDDVHIGGLLDADSIEALLGPTSILSGTMRADEVRVASPRVRLALDEHGHARLPARVSRGRAGGGRPAPRVRRIVVTEGELELAVGDSITVRAGGVELHPTGTGVRVVTGSTLVIGTRDGIRGELRFDRAGLDVDLPDGHVRRAVASGGALTMSDGQRQFALGDVILQHGVTTGELRFDGKTAAGASLSVLRTRGHVTATLPTLPVALLPFRPAWLLGDGELSGAIEATHDGDAWDLRVDLRAHELTLQHELLAPSPFVLGDSTLRGHGRWNSATHYGSLEADVVDDGVALSLAVSHDESGAQAHLRLPETPCAAILAAVPLAVRAPLDGLTLDGTLALEVTARAPRDGVAALEIALAEKCQAVAEATDKDPRALLAAFVHRLPSGATRRFAASDPDFAPIDRLPAHVPAAFVSAEDGRFFRHRGIDPIELERSFAADVVARKPVRGGSTLSQQVAKNLWLGRDRTLGRKLVEAVLTWRLEALVGKRRILEIYVNLIELGDGVYGIGPGARRWFDVPPHKLTVAQAAFLAAITPEPRSAEKRILAANGLDPRTSDRVRIVLNAMRRDRALTEPQWQSAQRDRLHLQIRPRSARLQTETATDGQATARN